LFGHPIVATGLGPPVVLFIVLVLLQLLPLPPALVKLVSPATARLDAESLPGYAGGQEVDFARTGSFLAGAGHDATVSRILEAPDDAPKGLSVRGSVYRPLSMYPYSTVDRLIVLLCLCIVFAVSLHVLSSRERIEWLLRALVLFGFALALFGIIQRLSWNGKIFWLIPVDPGASPFGPFVNHNHFAAYLAMIVPVATGLLMDEARRLLPGATGRLVATHGPEPFARLLLAAFVVGLMSGAVVLSASRGAVLALLGAFFLYGGALAVQGRFGRMETAAAVLLLVVAVSLSFWLGAGPLAQKLKAIGNVESEPSLYSRVLGYRATVDIIQSFPLAGTGLGTFPHAWKHVYPPGTASVWHEAHNDYLQLFAEAGAAGFAIFLAGLAIFAWRYLLPGILGRRSPQSYAVHGAAVGIVAAALHSAVDFPLQVAGCAVLFVVLSAAVVSHRRLVEAGA
ncbi:MAG TPA: O-antigen ligase family protein, partial [Candidatus Saccharimonadales bacterium]|nr:O-antigen ligase family protein [Candidatus Saccharimonadales bacterium]